MWLGDDFHHNGAFRLSYGFEYAALMERSKGATPFEFTERDTYTWFLNLGSLANVKAKVLGTSVPTWNDFANHPDWDAFWQRQGVARYLTRLTLPTLNVAGWWDQEDFYGPLKIYELLERHDTPANLNRLVVGPWNHGGWARGEGSQLGPIKFGQPTSKHYREKIQAPWFRHHLMSGPDPRLAEATVFETGGNQWKEYGTWPPKAGATPRKLYFHAGGKLSFTAPADSGTDAWVSDPAKPVPYRARPITPLYGGESSWPIWLVDDQRHADSRPDVMSYTTAPLESDVVVSGQVMGDLFVSTTGSDGDWIVKLIDVYPGVTPDDPPMGGYQLMVANEVFRARYRESWEKPVPMTPGKVTPLTVDMRAANHRFRKGHRIMVQVQNSWFPLIDRNPQTFVPNIFEAKESDFQAVTQTVHRSARLPSGVSVSVMEGLMP
jgi:putative CocE/NonD family hydrolase